MNQPQLQQFQRPNSIIPESSHNAIFQVTGHKMKKEFSPIGESSNFDKSPVLKPLSGESMMNYPKSPKNELSAIYRQTLKRPNYTRNHIKMNRRVRPIYPSPYQTKNPKLRSVKKSRKLFLALFH